ncbi:MAG: anaerobic ribonucleoside-triphosphate reductase activating protein [Lachnospiraceae bacterium]|nr:anaerobic ribonucleoside-triphosphate reductase activating protein [Lachnospiraceae bacterium]
MQIYGLNKTTLLDYPEHVAATIFTGGCNFCCPFCQNRDLVLHPGEQPVLPQEEVLGFLKKRRGILSGVCITGGEPTLQKDLGEFIARIKDLGYLVKLDTNGYKPQVLKQLLTANLLDYVAMDIKSSLPRYGVLAGVENVDTGVIKESVNLLKNSGIPYEYRTTVVRELHSREDFEQIGEWLAGSPAYFLQAYRENEGVICPGFSTCTREEMEEYADILRKTIKRVDIRGME